ncbi:MAG TPA: MBL fold metallo-hydrolase [Syntrophales bacterium]|nr:MBL fold metallo-hydrolase [Syntrophales bacterium]HOX93927.1 MBL fold metallo-hydrolase [Syntrophales bacterium]HPI57964.1 MBL fold metallo-hydrolase [Syntrophales bacterium]HPN25908.1 MBL fold metallo-hydrolase [Syntrophales bacterium]HQM29536.1 MBL fold metallo-hydrolase [Syntrophales bacterium]
MGVNIYPIKIGYDCCYLVQEQGIIMIDGGTPRRMKSFTKGVGRLPIEPEQIKLMVLTHGHWDHIGCAREIKEMTGAKIAIHGNEKEWLEKAMKPMPPGVTRWGVILAKAITMILPLVHIPAAAVDLVIGDEVFPLAEYGVSGRVIHTPGHTSGSVSVLLDTGDAFVGDMAMNMLPMTLRPDLPVFAEDFERLKESWRLLMDQGARTVYPAHGKPFPIEVIKEMLS